MFSYTCDRWRFNPQLRINTIMENKSYFQQNKVQSPTNAANNPFLSSAPNTQNQSIVDLFGPTPADTSNTNSKASEDLLSLSNPFADMFGGKVFVKNVDLQLF